MSARPWLLDSRNGSARGILNRWAADDRPGYCGSLNEVISRRFSDVLRYMWRGDDSDLDFAQDTSIFGRFAPECMLRTLSQEATLEEIATSFLRRLLARNKTCARTDAQVGYPAFFRQLIGRKSAPK